MTLRLAAALVEHIRQMDVPTKFLIMEAVPEPLAANLSSCWDDGDDRLPALGVVSCGAERTSHDIGATSVAGLRNSSPGGLCVVVCEGMALAERQSINGFVPVSPADLLATRSSLMLLSNAVAPARRDGPVAAVREALVTIPQGQRPSAQAVAAYFDRLAAGWDPMEQLPLIGAFRDAAVAAEVRSDRIRENLLLSTARRSDDALKPSAYPDIRARAERVLGRRSDPRGLADRFMSLLEAGSDDLLSFVTLDEAREILASTKEGLGTAVKRELADFRRALSREDESAASAVPWTQYEASADALERAADRKDAARDLIGFDLANNGRVFDARTRRQLQVLLRDRSITATPGSAVEVGIAQALLSLGATPDRLTLVEPHPPTPPESQRASRETISLALARLRLTPILQMLESRGCDVDGELQRAAFDDLGVEAVRECFRDAGLGGTVGLPAVKLKLGCGRSRVEVSWAPDADDAALLRALVEFDAEACLSLAGGPLQDPARFASGEGIRPRDCPPQLDELRRRLHKLCSDSLRDGLRPERLRGWAQEWSDTVQRGARSGAADAAEHAALAGTVAVALGRPERHVAMGPLAPLKAEWLADYLDQAHELVESALLNVSGASDAAFDDLAFDTVAAALVAVTATHYPAFLRLRDEDEPLLPTKESRTWSVFGGRAGVLNYEAKAAAAIDQVLRRLLRLQPEAAGHLKCLAVGPGSAGLLVTQAARLAGQRVNRVQVRVIEVFVIGAPNPDDRALADALAEADKRQTQDDTGAALRLRYLPDLDHAVHTLGPSAPAVHFALLTGLTGEGRRPSINTVDTRLGEPDPEVLFAPRLFQRPDTEQRVLLRPPGLSDAAATWLRLGARIDDRWPADDGAVPVPEIRTGIAGVADELRSVHDLAMWVATLDRYATRDSLERALGDEVAILHQEKRLGSDSPIGLVVSQKAGGPVDRAVGRSLRQARIVPDEGQAVSLGTELRAVASQGYGILALEAATSGTGINELVGHVVGFSLLGTRSTPWPLPPRCRVVLVSLDDHPEWFLGGKRADLLSLAIDTEEMGIHGAVIEVKARRSSEERAGAEALDQLRRTLIATAFAAHPNRGTAAARVWLNRIAEAMYAVARESRIRLSAQELDAVEAFRHGNTLEWAGLGLVFGPDLQERQIAHRQAIDNDWVPIAMHDVRLTQELLEAAVATDLRQLYTAETEAEPLSGGRRRRRPETGNGAPQPEAPTPEVPGPAEAEQITPEPAPATPAQPAAGRQPAVEPTGPAAAGFDPPILGWDQYTSSPLEWRAAGPGALDNAHVQIWGSSGAGKTQFVKMLLAQLAHRNRTHFGVADFKNDYGQQFPDSVAAQFIDMWGRPGAPYNPLALAPGDEDVDARIIEFRDSIEQAMESYQRIGSRQKRAIEQALREAYRDAGQEGRHPTMLDLNRHISDDIKHILGDLTQYEIFSDGPPLSDVLSENTIFALNRIPGNGQTTVLAAAFLLASVSLAAQALPPVAGTVRYALVVDEAHRVSRFRALDVMLREGRSKGLAVVLATQSPADLPEVVDTNAQTRICFRLSDAVVASQAARKLDHTDEGLAGSIRTLGSGEAYVSLQGERPRLATMTQHYRDRDAFDQGRLQDQAP